MNRATPESTTPTPSPQEPLGGAGPDDSDLGFHLAAPATLSARRAVISAGLVAAMLGSAFAVAYLPRRRAQARLEERAATARAELLRVEVVTPKPQSSDRAIQLPGDVRALRETVVYSRANGYVRRWLVDIGDVASDGQFLAELDTPELDQQIDQGRAELEQAKATVVQAKANRDFSAVTVKRYEPLTRQGVAAQQDLDQRRAQASVDEANVLVAEANVAAQQANMRRLAQLKAFARVTAPFAGKITQRLIEVGSLVTAGTASPLFKIAAVDPARVFVQIPQDVAPSIRDDVLVKVTVREFPGRTFVGTITRAAGELDTATRTMTTEVRVPNADGALIPGMYAMASLTLPYSHRVFEIPAAAVVSDARGNRVAVVGSGDVVRFVPIGIERDTGSTVEVSNGLDGSERLIRLPGPDLVEGRAVAIATASNGEAGARASSN
jgi:RND family efflux transporter MFP subunit